jgi:hypothetical protein
LSKTRVKRKTQGYTHVPNPDLACGSTPKLNFNGFSHENAIFIAQTEIVWFDDL